MSPLLTTISLPPVKEPGLIEEQAYRRPTPLISESTPQAGAADAQYIHSAANLESSRTFDTGSIIWLGEGIKLIISKLFHLVVRAL